MELGGLQCMKGLGPEPIVFAGSFQPHAGSDPSSTLFEYPNGLKFSVTYAATGTFTVTLPEGAILPDQPYAILVSAQYATLATDWFEVGVLGATTLNATARQFVVQAHRNGTAREVAATTGNRINFAIVATNSTGK
jgi:hypothetical protein